MENGASVYREVKDHQVIARTSCEKAGERVAEGVALRLHSKSWQILIPHRLRRPKGRGTDNKAPVVRATLNLVAGQQQATRF